MVRFRAQSSRVLLKGSLFLCLACFVANFVFGYRKLIPVPSYPERPVKRSKSRQREHLYELCPHHAIDFPLKASINVANKVGGIDDGLTIVVKGNLPVVISIPHGASTKDPLFSWQKRMLISRESAESFDPSSFQSRLQRVNSDTFTFELGKQIIKYSKKISGKVPYLVAARFHRRYVDVNRRLNETLKSSLEMTTCCEAMFPKCTAIAAGKSDAVSLAKSIYITYHDEIRKALNEVSSIFEGSSILFLDLHAQKASTDEALKLSSDYFADTIIVGTQDGRCVRSRQGLYAPGGLLHIFSTHLSQFGHIYPPSNEVKDHPRYNGGHIVAEYGFNNTIGAKIDAIQLEVGYNLRMRSNTREKLAEALARSILESEYVKLLGHL